MKTATKKVVFLFALLLVLPLNLGLILFRRLSNSDGYFQSVSQLLSIIPTPIGTYLRAAFYYSACSNVDREVSIGFATLLSHADIDLGKNVYIGAQSNIGSCSIGKDCLLGSGVHILSGKRQHDFSDSSTAIRNQGGLIEKIAVGQNCWIGNNATVMASVGDNSIIAAGSVVVNEIPANAIAGGNPARVLKPK